MSPPVHQYLGSLYGELNWVQSHAVQVLSAHITLSRLHSWKQSPLWEWGAEHMFQGQGRWWGVSNCLVPALRSSGGLVFSTTSSNPLEHSYPHLFAYRWLLFCSNGRNGLKSLKYFLSGLYRNCLQTLGLDWPCGNREKRERRSRDEGEANEAHTLDTIFKRNNAKKPK